MHSFKHPLKVEEGLSEEQVRKSLNNKEGPGYKKLRLRMPGLSIPTDGVSISGKAVTIIEIKDLEMNFTEGVSQLVQNFAVVNEHSSLVTGDAAINPKKLTPELLEPCSKSPSIETLLLYSKEQDRDSIRALLYDEIMQFMRSGSRVSFFVA